ncbi:Mov34/MPN/PAD-1 family protein [Thalassospira marina]|uniref:MPN domain-containing protein n=1 Tax=Thalassospira marina TaxID=2048283 RepID=A0A2N3KYF8_9PROT|nr:Mov34/MPN/PAD-1 family protein [Thalassospira marina]PKR55605.1 hypothetical protein COO20_05450 [Thalassospira marina]
MKILLPNNIIRKMRCQMLKASSREIGGILMGEAVQDQVFRVVDFTTDLKSGSASRFNRDSEQHDKALSDFFERTGADYKRFNYLGEWHTHPHFSVQPSIQDIHSMQNLVDGSGGVSFAVLLIARLRWFVSFESSAHLFVQNYPPSVVEIINENSSASNLLRHRKMDIAGS